MFKLIGMVTLLFGGAVLNGLALAQLWQWFIVPLGVKPLGIAQALGVSLLAAMLLDHKSGSDKEKDKDDLIISFILLFAKPGLFLLVGWLYTAFM
jgi:hypothetical protein